MSTRIHKCNCHSPFQDKEYGQGQRLFNDNDKDGASCTVCNSQIKIDRKSKEKK